MALHFSALFAALTVASPQLTPVAFVTRWHARDNSVPLQVLSSASETLFMCISAKTSVTTPLATSSTLDIITQCETVRETRRIASCAIPCVDPGPGSVLALQLDLNLVLFLRACLLLWQKERRRGTGEAIPILTPHRRGEAIPILAPHKMAATTWMEKLDQLWRRDLEDGWLDMASSTVPTTRAASAASQWTKASDQQR